MRLRPPQSIIHSEMDCGNNLHRIEDDLDASWIETWAGAGVKAIEEYLAKYLAFLDYLDEAAAAA
jgi:hypothetical protein